MIDSDLFIQHSYGIPPQPMPMYGPPMTPVLRRSPSLNARMAPQVHDSRHNLNQGGGMPNAQAPLIFGITKTSPILTNAQSRFASVVLDGVLGPLRLACHT